MADWKPKIPTEAVSAERLAQLKLVAEQLSGANFFPSLLMLPNPGGPPEARVSSFVKGALLDKPSKQCASRARVQGLSS
jgi:hypothetical protein